jgi:hypothetical protein
MTLQHGVWSKDGTQRRRLPPCAIQRVIMRKTPNDAGLRPCLWPELGTLVYP